jgi:hypothetical protein
MTENSVFGLIKPSWIKRSFMRLRRAHDFYADDPCLWSAGLMTRNRQIREPLKRCAALRKPLTVTRGNAQ